MIAAVVPAAGRGTRLGVPKGTVAVSGRTFVERILETLSESGIGTVRVVVAGSLPLPAAAGALPPSTFVVNPEPERGMLSSVRCGLRALPEGVEAVIVWPVDHPRVSRSAVLALVDAWRRSAAPVVVPTFAGRRGHPVLFAAEVVPELLAAPDDAGARAVVHAHLDREELAVDDPAVVDDIDTPDDLARAFARRP